MKKWFLVSIGFVSGSLAYAIGFVVFGMLGDLLAKLVIFLPPTVDLAQVGITASALGANSFAMWVFSIITKAENAMTNLAFSIYLICIAAIYLFAAIIGGNLHLLWYPALSFILNGIAIKVIFDGSKSKK